MEVPDSSALAQEGPSSTLSVANEQVSQNITHFKTFFFIQVRVNIYVEGHDHPVKLFVPVIRVVRHHPLFIVTFL